MLGQMKFIHHRRHHHLTNSMEMLGLQVPLDLKITRSSAIAVIADRTACSILTVFIVSTTSASANSQSAHLCARAVGTRHRQRHSVILDEPTRSARTR